LTLAPRPAQKGRENLAMGWADPKCLTESVEPGVGFLVGIVLVRLLQRNRNEKKRKAEIEG
jgi:hypothetical protein